MSDDVAVSVTLRALFDTEDDYERARLRASEVIVTAFVRIAATSETGQTRVDRSGGPVVTDWPGKVVDVLKRARTYGLAFDEAWDAAITAYPPPLGWRPRKGGVPGADTAFDFFRAQAERAYRLT